MKRVVVGLSGGVDSSVTAYLLKEQGYEVIGMFMKNWYDETVTLSDDCPWIDDSNDALLIAQQLDIPFQVIDLSKEYKERIVDYMFNEYQAGRTPNPDVLCNREVKFDLFLQSALELGADCVATGHYCRKSTHEVDGQSVHRLLAGVDTNKDQSYFLCQLTQSQLDKALFPIGELTKPEVRKIAEEIDLPTANKKDSQGLCFIGKVRLPDFLQQQLEPKQGDIIEINADEAAQAVLAKSDPTLPVKWRREDGVKVGEHNGAHFFTVGQRRGIQVGGKPEPLFVLEKDVKENVLYVGQGDQHPGLLRMALRIQDEELHWIRPDRELSVGETTSKYLVRIRYRQPLQQATIERKEGYYVISFEVPQSGIAAGQFAAWYDGDECIGSGVIAS